MPTPEERRQYIERIRAQSKTPAPSPAPAPSTPSEVRVLREQQRVPLASIEAEGAEDALRRELFMRFRNEAVGPVSDEEIERKVTEEMDRRKQPAFIGGFGGPSIPSWTAAPEPSRIPTNAPLPAGASLFAETLRPQIRVPQALENPFNDVEFERTLSDVAEDEKKLLRQQYAGTKAAYQRIRELNPESSTEDILRDVERQLSELDKTMKGEGPVIEEDPTTMGNIAVPKTGDPIEAALSRRVSKGRVPRLEPAQMAFLRSAAAADIAAKQAEDRKRLRGSMTTGYVEKPDPLGGRQKIQTVEARPYTEKEIDDYVKRKTSAGGYEVLDWWMDEAKRAEVLANPKKFIKGGVLFEKEYPTGATVESPVAYTVRSAMSPLNALAGAIGYAVTDIGTEPTVQAQKSAARPEKFKGMGLGENVAYNVYMGGGMTQEIGDLWKYNPNPTIREYAGLGQLAGFGADILGLGDMAIVAGTSGGIRAGARAAAATRAVEGAVAKGATLEAAGRGALAGWLESMPGTARLAKSVAPGDVRLVYGAKMGDEFEAAARYRETFDEAVKPKSEFPPSGGVDLAGSQRATEALRQDAAAVTAYRRELARSEFEFDSLEYFARDPKEAALAAARKAAPDAPILTRLEAEGETAATAFAADNKAAMDTLRDAESEISAIERGGVDVDFTRPKTVTDEELDLIDALRGGRPLTDTSWIPDALRRGQNKLVDDFYRARELAFEPRSVGFAGDGDATPVLDSVLPEILATPKGRAAKEAYRVAAYDKGLYGPTFPSVDSAEGLLRGDPSLAQDFRAALLRRIEAPSVRYPTRAAVDPAYIRGDAHEAAVRAVEASPYKNTKFLDDAKYYGPDMRRLVDDQYFKGASAEFERAADVAKAANKVRRGGYLTSGEELLMRPYLAAAAKADPQIQRAIAKAFEGKTGVRVTASTVVEQLRKTAPQQIVDKFLDAITRASSFEKGAEVVDTALAKIHARGGELIALTPKTVTSKRVADAVTEKYKATPFYREVVEPLQTAPRVEFQRGTKTVSGLQLTNAERGKVMRAANEAQASKTITAAEHALIRQDVMGAGYLGADSLRSLVYAQVDAVALAERGGLTTRALAAPQRPVAARGIGPGAAREVGQLRRAEEIQSQLPVWMRRVSNKFVDATRRLDPLVSPVQKQLIAEARGKVSALDRTLRDDYGRVSKDPNFAAMHGIDVTATPQEKLIALGRGTVNAQGARLHAAQFLDSIIYGSDRSPVQMAVMGDYRYGDNILKSVREYNKLIDDIAAMSPQQFADNLDDIFARAKLIVENNVNPLLTDAGGRVLSVPRELSSEALAVAYARTRASEIVAETATKLLPERGIGLSDTGQQLVAALDGLGVGPYGSKLYYEMVKREAANPGYWDNLSLRQLSGDLVESTRTVDGVVQFRFDGPLDSAFDDIISGLGALDDTAKLTLRDWLTARFRQETILAEGNGILDDVITHVELMKAEGLLHNNNVDEALARIDDLLSQRVSPQELVNPALAKKLLADIGTAPKYKEMLRELARQSDIAYDGNLSAAGAVRFIRGALDALNSFYYYSMLSLAPRFHGVNNLTASAIVYYTTGRIPNPRALPEAANILLLGAKEANPLKRAVPVVTDRLGNVYTRGDLYDLAMRNGVFRSQIQAELSGDFIAEAGRLTDSPLFKGRRALFTPAREFLGDPLAAWTDNMWRMESVTAALRDGKTVEEALDLGRRSLFDYGSLTPGERWASKNLFVFYNYFRQSTVQFVRNLVENPQRMVKLVRATTQPSKIMVGDQNAEELSYYYGPDFGMNRIVVDLKPKASAKEGAAVMLPLMPHADALTIAAGLFTDVGAWLGGPTPIGKDRNFAEGAIVKRLGPKLRSTGAFFFSGLPVEDLLEVKLTKNRILPEHVAVLMEVNQAAGTTFLEFFNAKAVDAKPNENAYMGKAYEVSDEDFERYKKWLNASQVLGTSRIWQDYGKLLGGLSLTGAYPTTAAEVAAQTFGAATYTGAAVDEFTQRRAMEARTAEMEEEARTLKERRLPARRKPER